MNEAGEEFAPEQSESVAQEQATNDFANPAVENPPETALSAPLPGSIPDAYAAESIRGFTDEGWLAPVQSLLITIIIAVFVITFVVQAFQIPSESMENTLLIGDYLLVDKAHFGPAGSWSWLLPYQKVKRGDIVVFRYPVDPKQHFVKRVVGTPGDRIRLINKRVYVNGQLQKEPFVLHIDPSIRGFRDNFPNGNPIMEHLPGPWLQQMQRLTEEGQLIVPDGFYFVMGDNRDDSSDSRYWGFVPRVNIIGRPLVIYWSVRNAEPDDPADGNAPSGGKLTRFAVALKQGWQDLRWKRMLTLVR